MSDTQLTWPQVIDRAASKFNEIASRSKLVTWAEESQFALQAIQKNEKLSQCLVHTVQNSVINVAAVGLTLNPALGYAYLVPEGVKQPDGKYQQECILRVSFKGLLKIATDSGSIMWAKAEVVKQNDTFVYRGPCDLPAHEMNPFGDRGATVGAYCIAKTHQGDYLVDVMGADEIAKIRGAAKQDYVWKTWPDEMTKKAIIKRASKQWPKTDRDDRLDRAIAVVNEYEGSEDLQTQEKDVTPTAVEKVTQADIESILDAAKQAGVDAEYVCKKAQIDSLEDLPLARFAGAMNHLNSLTARIAGAQEAGQ